MDPRFSFESYRRLAESSPSTENVVYSPLSVSLAMAMVMYGSKGNTLEQLGGVLMGTKIKEPELKAKADFFKKLIDNIIKGNESVMDMANLIYGKQGFTVSPEYQDTLAKIFGVKGLQTLDFRGNPSGAKTQVNGDVQKATRGKIKDLISDVDPNTALILVNAIYFNGKWDSPFSPSSTQSLPFTTASNEKKNVMLMYQKFKHLPYAHSDDLGAGAVLLPYKETGIKMMIVLPNPGVSIGQLEKSLSHENLQKLLSCTRIEEVHLWLPRFKVESRHQLVPLLKNMGALDIFDQSRADLSGISTDGKLHVSQVVQKAIIEVDEQGTVAAAATGVQIELLCARMNVPIEFRCDRPFVYLMILDQDDPNSRAPKNPVILFMGSFRNPP